MLYKLSRLTFLSTFAVFSLAGCGGGGGGGGGGGAAPASPPASTLLSGVIAAGAPVANGAGYALDAVTGKTIAFTTDANGNYSADLAAYSGPFLLHVIGITAGGAAVDMYSLASANSFGGTTNVTPLSNIVLAYAGGVKTQSLETACATSPSACPALLNGIYANLSTANATVVSAIPASVFAQFGLTPSTLNVFNTPFATTHTGLDGLMDALTVSPASVNGASNYTLSLAGPTPVTLATVPTTGTPGTQSGTAPVAGATPSTPALTQATNIALAQTEIQALLTNFGKLFATALPSSADVSPYIGISYLRGGTSHDTAIANFISGKYIPVGATVTGGGLSAYSGAPLASATPGVNVAYDTNNCVTSISGNLLVNGQVLKGMQFNDVIPTGNAAGVCAGGAWTMVGNGRAYASQFTPGFSKDTYTVNGTQSANYRVNLGLFADSSQSTGNTTSAVLHPWSTVSITGPGLTTFGTPGATGTVTLAAPPVPTNGAVLQSWASIIDLNDANDHYYGTTTQGSNELQLCTSLSANAGAVFTTPCFNGNATAGSDYTVVFKDSSGVVLETYMDRLDVTLASSSVPFSWFPIITGITPSPASSITTAGADVTTTFSLPLGVQSGHQSIQLHDASGATMINKTTSLTPTATASTIATGQLSSAPSMGMSYVSIQIGGLNVRSGIQF